MLYLGHGHARGCSVPCVPSSRPPPPMSGRRSNQPRRRRSSQINPQTTTDYTYQSAAPPPPLQEASHTAEATSSGDSAELHTLIYQMLERARESREAQTQTLDMLHYIYRRRVDNLSDTWRGMNDLRQGIARLEHQQEQLRNTRRRR